MATRYWVGGSGTWDAVSTTNWAASSGGSGGASVPTYADDVVFDSLSNATAYTVTLGHSFQGTGTISGSVLTITAVTSGALAVGSTVTTAGLPTASTYISGGTYITSFGTGSGGVGTYNINISQTVTSTTIFSGPSCLDVTMSGPLVGAVTLAGSDIYWNIYGSMALIGGTSGITWNANCRYTFCATTTGKTVNTNGVTIGLGANNGGLISFDGAGGGWTLASALNTTMNNTAAFRVLKGTFDTGNFNVTIVNGTFYSPVTTTRTINLGSSTLTFGNSTTPVNLVSTGLTFNVGTSTLVSTGTSPTFAGAGLTFYNVTFSNITAGTKTITGANTFNNLTFANRGSVGALDTVVFSANQTVNGTLALGNPINYTFRRFLKSDVTGTQRTITAASVAAFTAMDFQDIVIAGAAAPISGTSVGNAGNNSGITFSTPKTVYWNNTAGANWAASVWAATSGGTAATGNFPLVQDTAIIENTGLNSGATITNASAMLMGNVDFSTRTLPMTWALTTVPLFYGPLFLSSAVTITGQTIRTGTAADTYTISGLSTGTVLVQATAAGTLSITGTANGQAIAGGVAAGSLTITGTSAGTVIITAGADGTLNITGASAGTVKIAATASGTLEITGTSTGGVLVQASAAGSLTITGKAHGTGPLHMYYGTKGIIGAYYGSQPISRIYIGSTVILTS